MSTDQPLPARQRQQSGTSVHETEMDATGQRIWSAYGSSPGLIDLDYASAPREFSTLTRGAGSLSADIFARWGAHAGAPSSRVPMPFAGLRLQRKARVGVRGTPAVAGRRPATGVVARSQELGSRELTERVDSTSSASTSWPPDTEPVPRAPDIGGELQGAAGTPHAVDPAATIRPELVTSVFETRHLSPAGTPSSGIVRASSESEQVSAAPEAVAASGQSTHADRTSSQSEQASAGPDAVAASGQSTHAEALIRVQASARESDVAEERQQDHLVRTAPSAAVTAAESVSPAIVMSPRVPFQPLIWRKAATTWSGSLSRSRSASPAVSMFHPTANARWPLVSRTTPGGMPQNLLWTSGAAVMSAPRLADAHTEPDAPGRIAVAAVPPQRFHGISGVVIARAVSSSTRTTPAVLAVPSGVRVPRVFRAAAVTPTGAVTPATGIAAPAPRTSLPAAATTWIRHPAPTGSLLQMAPRLGAATVTIHQPVFFPAGAVSFALPHLLVSRVTSSPAAAALTTTSTSLAEPAQAGAASNRAARGTSLPAATTIWIQHPAPTGSLLQRAPPVTVAGHASGSVPFGSGTRMMTAGTIGRVAHAVFRSPLTLPARPTVSSRATDLFRRIASETVSNTLRPWTRRPTRRALLSRPWV